MGNCLSKFPWLVASATSLLACEFDIQLGPGEILNGSDAIWPSEDKTVDPFKCDTAAGSVEFLLALRVFADGPPLQLSMCIFFQETYEGGLSMMGRTQRLRPDDRRPYGETEEFGDQALGFVIERLPATYWTVEGSVELTISLYGSVIDEDFICGGVGVAISGYSYPELGEMTFAAQRQDFSMPLPEWVTVDCERRTLPAF